MHDHEAVSANQSVQLPGRPLRGAARTARGAAFGDTLLATCVSSVCTRGVAAGGPQRMALDTVEAVRPDRLAAPN